MSILKNTLVGLLALSAISAVAQGVPSAPYLSIAQKSTFLVMNKEVRVTLGLSAAQDAKISTALEARGKSQNKVLAARNPIESDIRNLEIDYANKVLAVLTPAQEQKLLGLTLQQVGVQALADAGIRKSLALTKAQTTKIDKGLAAIKKRRLAFDEIVAQGLMEAKDDAERRQLLKGYDHERKLMEADVKALDEKVLLVLTPAQKSKWTTLRG
jgi:hypothetical protein